MRIRNPILHSIKIRKSNGRVPFDQNFRKFRFKIKWNRNFPEIHFENFGSPLEVVLFSGNLEIPEISRSIWHFYPVWIGPNSFSREKLQHGGESFESYNTGCKIICHSSSLFLIENENVRILFPGKLWTCRSEFPVGQFARLHTIPREKFVNLILAQISRKLFWMRVKLLYMKHLTAQEPLHHDLSAFCRVILGGQCAQAGK